MEELATNRIVFQPGNRLGGRATNSPICGRLGTNNASFLKSALPDRAGRQTGQH
jgi:hypothetical protein